MQRYFGPDGHNRSLDFPEFAEFFITFQAEYAQQLFLLYDREHTGRIAVDDLIKLIPRMGMPCCTC